MPAVSVILPVYNGMPYLPEAVDSILEQSLKDLELIVVDDGSTDDTAQYLKGRDDPRVTVLHQARSGQGAARNRALSRCRSSFVALMDGDDVSMPHRLERQVEFLTRRPEVGAVGSRFAYLGPSGRSAFSPPLPSDHERIFSDLLQLRHALCHGTMVVRTGLFRSIGGYRIAGCGEDWDVMLRLGERSKLANLDDVLYLYRLHDESTNARALHETRLRFRHSALCARQRAEGIPETPWEEFLPAHARRSRWSRWKDDLDGYALAQYRGALYDLLGSRRFRGLTRLAWAGLCSPGRTKERLARALRGESPTGDARA